MLVQRRRCWLNINPASRHRLAFADHSGPPIYLPPRRRGVPDLSWVRSRVPYLRPSWDSVYLFDLLAARPMSTYLWRNISGFVGFHSDDPLRTAFPEIISRFNIEA